MTDAAGLAGALARDLDAAFPELVTTYQDRMYATALRLTRAPSDAEDVTQEALVRAYRALGGYAPDRIRSLQLRAWLWTILVNLVRNRARTRSRRPHDTALGGVEPAAGADPAGDAVAVVAVTNALGALRPVEREVLVLRYVADLPLDEVSDTLGIPLGTVKSHVHRSLARLRTILGEETR